MITTVAVHRSGKGNQVENISNQCFLEWVSQHVHFKLKTVASPEATSQTLQISVCLILRFKYCLFGSVAGESLLSLREGYQQSLAL